MAINKSAYIAAGGRILQLFQVSSTPSNLKQQEITSTVVIIIVTIIITIIIIYYIIYIKKPPTVSASDCRIRKLSVIQVGSEECCITKLMPILTTPPEFSEFYDKWPSIAIYLGVPSYIIRAIKLALILRMITLVEALYEIIENWIARNGSKATLDILLSSLLQANGLNICIEKLITEFSDESKK